MDSWKVIIEQDGWHQGFHLQGNLELSFIKGKLASVTEMHAGKIRPRTTEDKNREELECFGIHLAHLFFTRNPLEKAEPVLKQEPVKLEPNPFRPEESTPPTPVATPGKLAPPVINMANGKQLKDGVTADEEGQKRERESEDLKKSNSEILNSNETYLAAILSREIEMKNVDFSRVFLFEEVQIAAFDDAEIGPYKDHIGYRRYEENEAREMLEMVLKNVDNADLINELNLHLGTTAPHTKMTGYRKSLRKNVYGVRQNKRSAEATSRYRLYQTSTRMNDLGQLNSYKGHLLVHDRDPEFKNGVEGMQFGLNSRIVFVLKGENSELEDWEKALRRQMTADLEEMKAAREKLVLYRDNAKLKADLWEATAREMELRFVEESDLVMKKIENLEKERENSGAEKSSKREDDLLKVYMGEGLTGTVAEDLAGMRSEAARFRAEMETLEEELDQLERERTSMKKKLERLPEMVRKTADLSSVTLSRNKDHATASYAIGDMDVEETFNHGVYKQIGEFLERLNKKD